MGMRKHEGQGCILADEMYVVLVIQRQSDRFFRGLGKTLQVQTFLRFTPLSLLIGFRRSYSSGHFSVGLCRFLYPLN